MDNPTCKKCWNYNAVLNGTCRDCGFVASELVASVASFEAQTEEKVAKVYEVYLDDDGDFRIRGLAGRSGDEILNYHIPFPETETPEVSKPESAKAMHAALYDLYQWRDGLAEGDRFTTPFGNFRCVSFHVVIDRS